MSHKKAVSMTVVGLILVVLVMSLIIFFVVYVFKPGLESASLKSACEQSVLLKAKAKIIPGISSKVDLQCKTTEIQIDEVNEENTRKIADAMYDCWDQFGNGEVDFLDDWDFAGTDTFCFICSKIKFDKFIEGNAINLGTYLNENNPQLHELTYSEYFSNAKDAKLNLDFLDNLKTDNQLYILFFAKKGFNIKTLVEWKRGGAAAVGCAGGATLASFIPGVGTGLGCAGGAVIAYTTYVTTKKDVYTPGMYLTGSENVVNICTKSFPK